MQVMGIRQFLYPSPALRLAWQQNFLEIQGEGYVALLILLHFSAAFDSVAHRNLLKVQVLGDSDSLDMGQQIEAQKARQFFSVQEAGRQSILDGVADPWKEQASRNQHCHWRSRHPW